MKPRSLSDDFFIDQESTPPEIVDLLQRFGVGECWEKSFSVRENPNDISHMMKLIDALKEAGLDIGGGQSQFGYKMPIPTKDQFTRVLQIFRRNNGDA